MFKAPQVEAIYCRCIPHFKHLLTYLNNLHFSEAKLAIKKLDNELKDGRDGFNNTDEPAINDLFLLGKNIELLDCYTTFWEKVAKQEFSDSWNSLQDGLDLLRILKKFLDEGAYQHVSFFEHQFKELEKLYPYNVFFSIGATYKWAECNICGRNIDSFECEHQRGELYSGKLAYGIVHSIERLDHVAMVTNPEDKRCVVNYDDNADQFKLVRYLSDLLIDRRLNPLYFSGLKFSKREIKNPNFRKLGRNAPCFCGSGKKFKKCCISMEYIEGDHVDILATPRQVDWPSPHIMEVTT